MIKVLHKKLNELSDRYLRKTLALHACMYRLLPLCMQAIRMDFIVICSCCFILFRKIYGEVVGQSLLMVEHIMSYYFFKETGFRWYYPIWRPHNLSI
jgi:hypothetical protein